MTFKLNFLRAPLLWIIGMNSLVTEKMPANKQLIYVEDNKYLYDMKIKLTSYCVLHYQLQVYQLMIKCCWNKYHYAT